MIIQRRATGIVILLFLLVGCVSTRERFQRGIELERQGRYAEAAEYYVEVLEREPTWENARIRLRDVGARAVEAYLAEAAVHERLGQYEEALQELDRLDALREEAYDVGVTLEVPDDYAELRSRLTEEAFAMLLERGERAERQGEWREALAAYERAKRYAPGRRAELAEMRARVYLRWAEEEYERGGYQGAFTRADQVVQILGPEHPLARRALELQDVAVEAGTQRVAFLPVRATESVLDVAPEYFLIELSQVLEFDYWADPVPFVATADPVRLRRELRRLGYDRTDITRSEASAVGRLVGADYVVASEVVAFERDEDIVEETVRRAVLAGRHATVGGPEDTTYVEQLLRLELGAEAEYRVIDPRTRTVVDRGTVQARVSDRLRRAVYAGDYRDLDLTAEERERFEEGELAEDELATELVDALAMRLAERIYEGVLEQIP